MAIICKVDSWDGQTLNNLDDELTTKRLLTVVHLELAAAKFQFGST